MIYLTVIG